MKAKHQRLCFLLGCLVMMGLGITAILYAFNDNLIFFYTPTQLEAKMQEPGFDPSRGFRLGGLVKKGSVKNLRDGGIRFAITDLNHERNVVYRGMIPSLFRENQGVVAQGTLGANGELQAATILAKHDEQYMPREVVDALKASGRWREDGGYRKKATP